MVVGGKDARKERPVLKLAVISITLASGVVGGVTVFGNAGHGGCASGTVQEPTAPAPPPVTTMPPMPEADAGPPDPPAETPDAEPEPWTPEVPCLALKASERAAKRAVKREFPESRVVNGKDAKGYPWTVSFQWRSAAGNWSHYCGGSLVRFDDRDGAPRYDLIVGAAHCMTELADRAVLGRYDLRTSAGHEYHVREVLTHKLYDDRTFDYDVAVVQLDRPATEYADEAITLASQEPEIDTHKLLGWGLLHEDGHLSPKRQGLDIPLLPRSYCASVTGTFTARMACWGWIDGGSGGCQGDSGGPYAVWPDGSGWQLVGIVSHGRGCARPNAPDYGTWVPGYVASWLRSCAATLEPS